MNVDTNPKSQFWILLFSSIQILTLSKGIYAPFSNDLLRKNNKNEPIGIYSVVLRVKGIIKQNGDVTVSS